MYVVIETLRLDFLNFSELHDLESMEISEHRYGVYRLRRKGTPWAQSYSIWPPSYAISGSTLIFYALAKVRLTLLIVITDMKERQIRQIDLQMVYHAFATFPSRPFSKFNILLIPAA